MRWSTALEGMDYGSSLGGGVTAEGGGRGRGRKRKDRGEIAGSGAESSDCVNQEGT